MPVAPSKRQSTSQHGFGALLAERQVVLAPAPARRYGLPSRHVLRAISSSGLLGVQLGFDGRAVLVLHDVAVEVEIDHADDVRIDVASQVCQAQPSIPDGRQKSPPLPLEPGSLIDDGRVPSSLTARTNELGFDRTCQQSFTDQGRQTRRNELHVSGFMQIPLPDVKRSHVARKYGNNPTEALQGLGSFTTPELLSFRY